METLVVYGFVGWIYVAVLAVVHPERLDLRVVWWVPVRVDTFGIVAFAVSAVCYVLLAFRSGGGLLRRLRDPRCDTARDDSRRPVGHRAALALLRTVHVYSSAVWLYLAANSVSHPETLAIQLTHQIPWPTEGNTASACFIASMVTFYALRCHIRGIQDSEKGNP